jgi:hypothetical protein
MLWIAFIQETPNHGGSSLQHHLFAKWHLQLLFEGGPPFLQSPEEKIFTD